jgi:hypothetical protein
MRLPLDRSIIPERFPRTFGKALKLVSVPKSTGISQETQHDAQTHFAKWHAVLTEFFRGDLTFSDDASPAMSGIAREFARRRRGEYLAGTWRANIRQGLTWHKEKVLVSGDGALTTFELMRTNTMTTRQRNGPTWSWANSSKCGSLASAACSNMHVRHAHTSDAKLIDVSIAPAEVSDPFGRILNSTLELSGLCQWASIYINGIRRVGDNLFSIPIPGSSELRFDIYIDEPREFIKNIRFCQSPYHYSAEIDKLQGLSREDSLEYTSKWGSNALVLILSRWDVIDRTLLVKEQLHALLLEPQRENQTRLYRRYGMVIIDCPMSFFEKSQTGLQGWAELSVTVL